MTLLQARHLWQVWAALSALSILSGWISASRGAQAGLEVAVTLGVLAVAWLKCRLIMQHFMEVRTSARWLRLFSDLWLAVFFALLAAIYLYGRRIGS